MIGSYVAFIVIAGLTMMGLDSLPLLIIGAFAAYVAAVKDGSFPAPEHCY